MSSEIEKPRITELQVRMDCNGCVQKIRKALHGIHGIYEVYPDIARQKLTVIGWADPEKIVKAIRKTRKTVTICSHSEPPEEATQPPEQPPETTNPTPSETQPPADAYAASPQPEAETAEPPKDQPPPETPQPELAPAPADVSVDQQPPQPSGPKDVGVHVICHQPPDCGYRYGYAHSYGGGPYGTQYPTCHSQCSFYPNGQPFHHQPLPQSPVVTHSYNTYKPSPYVTEYEYVRSPPRHSHYSRIDHYRDGYYSNYSYASSSNGNGNISSMFSDENPNACSIM
ncbi:leucine-rich repeat extensin-like protein 3 [Hibiscus syriacus]|uniref:leucine-rich repeat extensin-like protein 3 n=1 Tax=Hibiscus syriacus TaxID=106335 RepID=UPI001920B9A2|nr:leucine-rich repeat extensin-like protein 3 [Hibiscus syriacus]